MRHGGGEGGGSEAHGGVVGCTSGAAVSDAGGRGVVGVEMVVRMGMMVLFLEEKVVRS